MDVTLPELCVTFYVDIYMYRVVYLNYRYIFIYPGVHTGVISVLFLKAYVTTTQINDICSFDTDFYLKKGTTLPKQTHSN